MEIRIIEVLPYEVIFVLLNFGKLATQHACNGLLHKAWNKI